MTPALGAASVSAAERRPNIVVVVMDDFGIGHFAPLAQLERTGQFDPAFVDFLKRHDAAYTPQEALDFARRAMPVMLQLGRHGAVFSNSFATSNLCAPSRCGVLSGRLQNRMGLYQNSDVEYVGLPKGVVLAERLQKAGYATGFIGKWHAGVRDESLREGVMKKHGVTQQQLAGLDEKKRADIEREIRATGYLGAVIPEHNPLRHGFDYYFGYNRYECPFYDSEHIWENYTYTGLQKQYNTELFTSKAIEFIQRARQQGKPFFVEVATHAVHGPLKPKAPDRYFNKFPSKSYDLTNFYAHVNAVDEGVAVIRDAIGEEWNNTLFIFCADNGAPVAMATPLPGNAPFHGHKGTFIQGGIRTPMLAHWPAKFSGGQRREELVSMLDIMPTALDAAGVQAPAGIDGASLLPLLTGKSKIVHEHLIWAGIHARAWGFTGETVIGSASQRREESPGAWVTTDGRYLLRFVTTTPPQLFRELPDGAPAHFELFDIREDPGETRNLYEQIPQVARRLEEVYKKQARTFPPPARWRVDRWREMVPPDNIHLKDVRQD